MVKKLFYHEYLAWLRIVPLIYVATLLAAGILRLVLFLAKSYAEDYPIFNVLILFASLMLIGLIIASVAAPVVFGVTRFYKHLFTGEGYLTLTLPVTVEQHLWVKVVTSGTFNILSSLVIVGAVAIILPASFYDEASLFVNEMQIFLPQYHVQQGAVYILESLLLMLLSLFTGNLVYYCCICVGQLSRKNRILSAVGAYFLYYTISQIVVSVFSFLVLLLGDTAVVEAFYEFSNQHPTAFVHLNIWSNILGVLVISAAFFLICRHIMHKKLNLE